MAEIGLFNFEKVEQPCADFQENPRREIVAGRTCFIRSPAKRDYG
jgi:hypothetical protein